MPDETTMNTTPKPPTPGDDRPCGLLRRMLIMTYDALPVIALVFIAALAMLPITGDQALFGRNPAYTLYVLTIIYIYFSVCWVKLGQTLGMRTWKVKLVSDDGKPIGWRTASIRFASALLSLLPFGLGYWSSLLRKDRACWHDRISGTRLLRID